MMVVLPFRGMGRGRTLRKSQQATPGTEVKNGRSSVKDGAPEMRDNPERGSSVNLLSGNRLFRKLYGLC